MAATGFDRAHVKQVELACECVSIADEVERLAALLGKRAIQLKVEARELAGVLDGAGKSAS